jgi:prolipoprotein diacylglyceryltransferase
MPIKSAPDSYSYVTILHETFDGQVILSYALLYAAGRYVIEFFRGDLDRGFALGGLFSTSQFIAIIVMAVYSILLFWRIRARNTSRQ